VSSRFVLNKLDFNFTSFTSTFSIFIIVIVVVSLGALAFQSARRAFKTFSRGIILGTVVDWASAELRVVLGVERSLRIVFGHVEEELRKIRVEFRWIKTGRLDRKKRRGVSKEEAGRKRIRADDRLEKIGNSAVSLLQRQLEV
jgi:hypothetical protein